MRGNTLDALRRAYLNLTRGRIESVDDTGPIQLVSVRLMPNELPDKVEVLHHYGFHSVAMPPDQKSPKGAEGIFGFLHGNRSHPVMFGSTDRRTKPKNWQEGDSGLWHYQGAFCKHTPDGWVFDAGSQKKPHTTTVGNASVKIEDGKVTATVNHTKVVVADGVVYLGGDPTDGGTFGFVETDSGTSTVVKAKL